MAVASRSVFNLSTVNSDLLLRLNLDDAGRSIRVFPPIKREMSGLWWYPMMLGDGNPLGKEGGC